MYILGINAFHGDSSAALIKDGKLVFAIEEERLRRVKHWAGFPELSIKAALQYEGIKLSDVEHITIARNPYANFWAKVRYALTRIRNVSAIADRLRNQQKVMSLKQLFAQALNIPQTQIKAKFHFVEHHRAHMASSFFVSPFQKAALLSIDGFGDFSSTMVGVGEDNFIDVFAKVIYPHSVGIFYTAFTQWLGFPKYGDEYKVMGLAPYGKPQYVDKILQNVIYPTNDGLFRLNTRLFKHSDSGVKMSWNNGSPHIDPLFNEKFIEIFGPPREPKQDLTQYHKDIAASVQKVTEIIIFHILNHLYNKVKIKNLAIAGGVAQNSVANGKIYLHTPFENVYVPPAATDAGTAVGSAMWVYYQLMGNERSFQMKTANWGQKFDDQQITAALKQKNLKYEKLDDAQLFDVIVESLINGGVVGWFYDRTEFGPRALGYRSILADPRKAETRDILNLKIKKREPFRPFAPSVLEEYVDEFFEQNHPVPFMEKVFKIKPEKQHLIPAVTHVDGTGRLQTVSKQTNPRYYNLIYHFYKKTGIQMLMNTYFNEHEPIVNTPQEAIDTFLRTKMDLLVMENFLIRRPNDA